MWNNLTVVERGTITTFKRHLVGTWIGKVKRDVGQTDTNEMLS